MTRGDPPSPLTVLNNTRCTGDVGQFHDMASWTLCSPLCLAQLSAPVFSFCSPASAPASCPVPNGTCWCYATTSSCSPEPGWTSGFVTEPPVAPPADWADAIARGDMKFTADSAEAIGPGSFPVVGTGFVGFETGPFTQLFVNSWPWRDAGSLKMAGVYSGYNFASPSHRAQIPKVSDVLLLAPPGANVSAQGCAIDFARGVYFNRTLFASGVPGCADGTVVEQRVYAHRELRELFVFELRAFSATGDPTWSGCTVPVAFAIAPSLPALNDTDLAQTLAPGAPAVWAGTTLLPEEPGLPLRKLAVVFDAWAAAAPTSLTFTPAAPLLSIRAVLRSDLDVEGAQTPGDVAAAAQATWEQYTAQSPAALLASHEAAMAALWASGVELAGNASLAANVNASVYDIVSSLRADWNWSTSPGGIATGGYSGHSFWVRRLRRYAPRTASSLVARVSRPDISRRAPSPAPFPRPSPPPRSESESASDGSPRPPPPLLRLPLTRRHFPAAHAGGCTRC